VTAPSNASGMNPGVHYLYPAQEVPSIFIG
jgi:hypothetical protein